MKLLYHHRTLGDGAEGIHIREMIAAFRGLGHDVRVAALVGEQVNGSAGNGSAGNGSAGNAAFNGNGASTGNEATLQRRWSRVSRLLPGGAYELAELGYNLVARRAISRMIRQFRPDFVYDRYNSYSTAAVDAARRAGVPVVLEVNAPVALERMAYEHRPLRFPRLAQRLERRICRRADHVFAVSTPLKQFLVDERGVPAERITVLPNGADPGAFDPARDGRPVRDRFGIGQRTVVGFVGILRPWHGLDMLLESLALLLGTGLDLHLLVIGSGPIEEQLRLQAARLGIAERVTFTGRVAHGEIQSYVAAVDVAVSPRATFYASPMKILEYMAMGLPTVAPRMANILDILEDGEDSVLFEPDDGASLAAALSRLATDRALARQLGETARRKIESRFNWTFNAQCVLDHARRLIAIKHAAAHDAARVV